MFSISWKFVPFVCIFLTDPGTILFMRLQRMTPSLSTSSYGCEGSFSPTTASIHWSTSASCSLFLACGYSNITSISSPGTPLHFQFTRVYFLCFIYTCILQKGAERKARRLMSQDLRMLCYVLPCEITFIICGHSVSIVASTVFGR